MYPYIIERFNLPFLRIIVNHNSIYITLGLNRTFSLLSCHLCHLIPIIDSKLYTTIVSLNPVIPTPITAHLLLSADNYFFGLDSDQY